MSPEGVTRTATHISNLRRWNLCRRLSQHFWERWSSEYLTLLQKRQKWRSSHPNYKIGDIVLVKDSDLFVRTWPLGKVVATHPGKDNLVRAVMVKTAKGTFSRPIAKLILLLPDDTPTSEDTPLRVGEDVQATP